MMKCHVLLLIFLVSLFSFSALAQVSGPVLETGVSRQLAVYRKKILDKVGYTLELDIPKEKTGKIAAVETIRFNLSTNLQPLQIDFKEDKAKLWKLEVNGQAVSIVHLKEHVLIDTMYLKEGTNQVRFEFQAGDAALNRNSEYLYALFVPDRARTVFPCFDQPDIKATYNLTLKVPADWKAMANGALKDVAVINDRKTYRFDTSDTLSTYLFSFVAGKFKDKRGDVARMKADFLYRETDPSVINSSMGEIFKIHSGSLKYLESWTGIPYPFQKFGFAAIPDFQFGGMEHVGVIHYKANSLFLDKNATKDQLNSRQNLIAHETAHMWFGDLVTMDWFTDVWMKEVFANFMADKSAEESNGKAVFDQKFLVDHFPAAYSVDRTAGANPIRQELDNLKDAGTLYGNIIYHKAPIMMRQLERLMGKEKFQQGVRAYLKQFANSNASWPDLINILDKYTDADLQQWNKVWVNEPGRPVIDYTIEHKAGKIGKFLLKQAPEYGANRLWPQFFELTLFYPGQTKEITVNLNAPEIVLSELEGTEVPSFVLFNSSGQGYGLWPVDALMFDQLYAMDKPLHRASAYISLYENMLNGRFIKPMDLLSLLLEGTAKEKDELNLKLITGYISTVYWEFITPQDRQRLADGMEKKIWAAIGEQQHANLKKILFKTYQEVFLSKSASATLTKVWKKRKAPKGVKLSEGDYSALALSLALRSADNSSSIFERQLKRIRNKDRKQRFEFIMAAASSDLEKRDGFFKRLELRENRAKEANVVQALTYLHHPLRQSGSVKYLPKSLELLEEIQSTGDIFFPQGWLQATFGCYQSAEAANVVQEFLKRNPGCNPKLKGKLLQAVDNLFRAQQLLKP